MSRQTELMVKISIVGMEIVYIAGIAGGLYLYSKFPTQPGGLIVAACFGFVFLIFNCMLYCYRDRLKVAVAVIDAAADYYAATKRLILISLLYFCLHIVFFGFMFAVILFLYSAQPM